MVILQAIFAGTGGACRTVAAKMDLSAASADPACLLGRVPYDERIILHILTDYSAGANKSISADRDTAHDRGIRSNGGSGPDQSGTKFLHPRVSRFGD